MRKLRLRVSAEAMAHLRVLRAHEGVATSVALVTASVIFLSRWTSQDDIVVLVRGAADDSLLLRLGVGEEGTAEQLFAQVAAAMRDAQAAAIGEEQVAPFELRLSLIDEPSAAAGTLEFSREQLQPDTIARMAASWRRLLQAMLADVRRPVGQLQMLTVAERKRVLHAFNDTVVARSRDRLIHELFEDQVRRTPDATAVVHQELALTYDQLNRRANRLARHLRQRGVGPDQPVAIYADRSVDMVVGLLGALKAGGAYLPLDPGYPADRVAHMIHDASPRVVLTQEKLRGTLPPTNSEVLTLDVSGAGSMEYPDENLPAAELGLTARHLLYVIYTSGSTGLPKGTAMSHGAMVNLIQWHRENLPLQRDERVLQFAALSFDVAFQETFSTLCDGGTLVLLDDWIRRDAQALAELLTAASIHRLFLPPLMLQTLAECYNSTPITLPPHLREVITAGEQLRITPEVRALFRRLGACRLHNHYGPTEAHVVTTFTLTGEADQWPTLPPIGRPIANTRIYVLDRHRQPVPVDVIGEIYIGGANLARGYLNRPQLTAERFLADPFAQDAGARLYRTGDLGRWRADGILEHLGRNDHQVKIRGFRIELGEIESQLARAEHVKDAVVIAREDVPGQKRLVAYVTLRDGAVDEEKLQALLKSTLPDYMIPSAFIVLDSLPLTPNGKLDRQRLPAPAAAQPAREFDPPQGSTERRLAAIWQEVLQVQRVGRQDHFFDLGGDSLGAMRVAARVAQRFAIRFHAHTIFRNPRLVELASAIARTG